jgi:hypothetical protein
MTKRGKTVLYDREERECYMTKGGKRVLHDKEGKRVPHDKKRKEGAT